MFTVKTPNQKPINMAKSYPQLLFALLACCCPYLAVSQENNKMMEKALWINPVHEITNIPANAQNGSQDYALLNFNFPIDFKRSQIPKKIKGVIEKQSSLFVVFKSVSETEDALVTFQGGQMKSLLNNGKLVTEKEEIFSKSNPRNGTLVTHIFNKNSIVSRKKGAISFEDALYADKEGLNRMYELLYFPRALNNKEQQIIESYLAIKYGVSLIGGKNYYNSKGDTIWRHEPNAAFSNRITGLGRDDGLKLYQKQSANAVKDGLSIGLGKLQRGNSQNLSELRDNAFLLWGDNNGNVSFEKKTPNGATAMARTWMALKTEKEPGSKFVTQIILDKKLMKLPPNPKDNLIWLAIDTLSNGRMDFLNAAYIKPTIDNDSIVQFDHINFTSPRTLFTFVMGQNFMVIPKLAQPDCTSVTGKLDLEISGTGPFEVSVSSADFRKTLTAAENFISIDKLPPGDYTAQVSDALGKTQLINFAIDRALPIDITLDAVWALKPGNTLKITPVYSAPYTFEWLLDEKVVSTGNELIANATGAYKLIATDAGGCRKELPFDVIADNGISAGFGIYPNPARTTGEFTIWFDFANPVKVSLTIADLSGKIILSENLGMVTKRDYKSHLEVAGTYLIIINKNGVQQTSKLVIY